MMLRGLGVGFVIACAAIVGCTTQGADDESIEEVRVEAASDAVEPMAEIDPGLPGITIGTTPTCCKLVCTDPPDSCDDCTYSCKFDCAQRVPCKIRVPIVVAR